MSTAAFAQTFDPLAALRQNDVVWTEPGAGPDDSMPLGNGDIGLNVWTERNGDLVFYISKTDAWGEAPARQTGLMKLGRVRVSFSPALDTKHDFEQALRLEDGEIVIREGGSTLRVWVDANRPAIHVAARCAQPESMKVSLEVWRTEPVDQFTADVVERGHANEIAWYHHDGAKSDPHVKDWTFGGVIRGLDMRGGGSALEAPAATSQEFAIYPLAETASNPKDWLRDAESRATALERLDQAKTWAAHTAWWRAFWDRSWIYLSGDQEAAAVTQGYVLQRFISAASGRGGAAIKFNGSIFVVDNPHVAIGRDADKKDIFGPVNADYRAWGGQYWFQNTRPIYWPMLAQGDFDEMLPLFRQVRAMMPYNESLIRQYYGHDGFYFAETAPFWGGLRNLPSAANGAYTDFYFTPVLELSMMMLDYFEYTGDKAFASETMLPVASAGVTFFDRHWKRDAEGKLLLDPDNSIEMFWKVHDPAPDIAGLRAVLPRLLALPADLTTPVQRAQWTRLLGEVPPLPIGTKNGATVLLPYTGDQTQASHNSENPELYAIYPFRLYGVGKPELKLAMDTFDQRSVKTTGCWVQDPVQAAYLAMAGLARKDTAFDLTRKDKRLKFPAFWDPGHDYMPDEDNGGNGELALERMLLQADGGQLLLLPAWPAGWNAQFKLYAPRQTVVTGHVQDGKLVAIEVTPASRKADVVVMDGAIQ